MTHAFDGKKEFPNAEKISSIRNPLDWDGPKSRLFVNACREMAIFHRERSPEIRHIYARAGFDPESLRDETDVLRVPTLGVSAMKKFLITSLPHDLAVLKLTSSGTRGQKTQIWFDQGSLDRVQKMMDVYLEQEGLVSTEPTNYLVFSYDPDDAKDLGVAYTEKNQLRFAPAAAVHFALKKDARGEWAFDKPKAFEVLKNYAANGKPVRVFGMPAFLFEFVEHMRENAAPVKLPEGSLVLTGGGWKAAEDKKITRDAFRALCGEAFGIPPENQRDAYGMAEHCAPYFECRKHRFHVPAYNRIIIRDPVTWEKLRGGEPGLMELVTPFNAMMPTLALMSTDYGKLHAEACPCGYKSPTFEVLGRAGLTKHKGCAITAADIVKRS